MITPRSIYGGEGGGGEFGGGVPMPTVPGVSTAPPGTQGPPGTSNFVVPAFYRTPMFPYANLADQLQDALGLSSRGAGVYANQMYGKAQHIKNMPANMGGGLLGMTAYGRGIGMPPGGGMPPGYPPAGGGGPGGGPVPPGGYAPGAPMPRPNPNPGRTAPPPGPGSTRPMGPAPLPWSRGNPPPPGGGLLPAPTGTPTARSTPAAPTGPAGPGMAPPTGATSDPKALAALFMSTDPANRGNLFNAISQYGLKTGNGNLGGLLQTELKSQLGADAQRNWLTTMDTKQGSTVGREGLPPWLISALGG